MRQKTHKIGILSYPGAQAAAVHGLGDLFTTANRLHAPGKDHVEALEVVILEAGVHPPPVPRKPFNAIIIPPSMQEGAPKLPSPALVAWVTARHQQGSLLCSICAGAFLLGETGLLNSRPATTHWALKDSFKERFPDVTLDIDRLVIDDGDIVTAGGMMAWVDLGLLLIDRFISPTTMLETARHFLVDPGGREQRFYSTFSPTLTHGDAAILKVQRWLKAKASERITVTQMAMKAALGERTFLRRFQAATGLNPTEYLQLLRVAVARGMLELSTHSVDEIASRVGYEDPGAFRKIFKRTIGLSPSEYRRRFTHI